MENARIVIVGAGVAGLVAARHLEEAGHAPLVIDAYDRAGGRVRTDIREGYRLDLGFQVLLTAYPEAQRYLDLDALDLCAFRPGARVFMGSHSFKITDPLREPSRLPRALFSPVGTLMDKFRVLRLSLELLRKEEPELFKENAETSEQFLRRYGFSDRIIERFFRPFFGGIFLEQALATPAAELRFVFKMFGEGLATLPAEGMEAIPRQLAGRLKRTDFRFDTRARAVEGRRLLLEQAEPVDFDALILTCPPQGLLPGLAAGPLRWNGCSTLYYTAPEPPLRERLISLVVDPDSPINNFCTVTQAAPTYAENGALVQVTLKDMRQTAGLEDAIADEIRSRVKQPNLALRFLARYDIPESLPALPEVYFSQQPSQTRLTDTVFVAGDHQLNGSLDAAMRSGRNAALGVLEAIA